MDNFKDRAKRLIKYLKHLASIRSKIVRDINEYPHVLWLHKIPKDSKYCFTQAWGPNDDYQEDIWIEITKHDAPILEEVPINCEKWINESSLYDTEDMPELLKSINVQIEENNPDFDSERSDDDRKILVDKTLKIEDYPEVKKEWDQFVVSKWLEWAVMYDKWQSVQEVYGKLFKIYQEQLKLGEEYELIIAIGYLTWLTPKGQIVRRHLFVGDVTLNFDAPLGKFTISPSTYGPKIREEFDMLDLEDQPQTIRQIVKDELPTLEDNPWDKEVINKLLKALTNSLSDQGQGEYHDNIDTLKHVPNSKPNVEYAPALILRKRSVKGLEETLNKIYDQIDIIGSFPNQFIEICESNSNDRNLQKENSISHTDLNQTIYFPKLSNKEQRDIVHKLNSSTGVFVQGPPGTGKSHTIANLLCNLLATGQRVLVTAKTPRALKVLHNLIPEKLQPLCISLLESGIDEQRALEGAVQNIITQHESWQEKFADEKIEELQKIDDEIKSEKAKLGVILKNNRGKEINEHNILDGKYIGTTAKIAQQTIKESTKYNWFKDQIKYENELKINIDDILKLPQGIVSLDSELELLFPDPNNDLMNPNKFEELVLKETEQKEKNEYIQPFINKKYLNALLKAEISTIENIIGAVNNLLPNIENISNRPMPWIANAVREVLSDNDTPWKDLHQLMDEKLNGLKERARNISDVSFTAPPNLNRINIIEDAKVLKKHFDKGGKMGWWIFKPSIVKEKGYIINDIKINTHKCNNSETIGILIEYLSVCQSVDNCWKLWDGKAERKGGQLILQVSELEELMEALTQIVELYNQLINLRKLSSTVKELVEPLWYDQDSVRQFLQTCQSIIYEINLNIITKKINEIKVNIENISNSSDAHPINEELIEAIDNRYTKKYNKLINHIEVLKDKFSIQSKNKINLQELKVVAPLLNQELINNPTDQDWQSRLEQISEAWDWARANDWIKKQINEDDYYSKSMKLQELEEKALKNMEELTQTLAWKFCINRMSEGHLRHLKGWQQATKKIGRGTGRHAPRHRRDAQRHLNECKDAVPVWIMPLHKVYDTVDAKIGMFDTIIVDEASQCGPEAIPLIFLSKRIVVIGDDKQISPEGAWINRDQYYPLMEEYLSDFAHRDSFDIDTSLFDHAKRRFNKSVVLREHFRCVPEIIRFSNDLSYKSMPLLPLRQPPPKRLEPLKCIYVEDGYREGQGSKVINKNEAEKLVNSIVECCDDEKYDNKSMGVITLLGHNQHNIIQNMLLDELGAEELENRKLICGNPYNFQGDERDVIFLSMVAAPNERMPALTTSSDQRRFNVAASRAKDQMWLFHSAKLNDLSTTCLRRRLLEFFQDPISQITQGLGVNAEELRLKAHQENRSIENPPSPYDSWFEVDVALTIASRGYRVIPQYEVAGKRIDLVIEGINSRLAVECYGDYWHGPDQYEKDIERQRDLERVGWRFHIIWESLFLVNQQKSLEKLWKELEYMKIEPIPRVSVEHELNEVIKTEDHSLVKSSEKSPKNGFQLKSIDVEPELNNEVIKTGDHNLVKSSEKRPKNSFQLKSIDDALSIKNSVLKELIIDVLSDRPNKSCVKDALTGFVLKELNILSRGKPRERFKRKISRLLNQMEKESILRTYKSKNLRIQLIYK